MKRRLEMKGRWKEWKNVYKVYHSLLMKDSYEHFMKHLKRGWGNMDEVSGANEEGKPCYVQKKEKGKENMRK